MIKDYEEWLTKCGLTSSTPICSKGKQQEVTIFAVGDVIEVLRELIGDKIKGCFSHFTVRRPPVLADTDSPVIIVSELLDKEHASSLSMSLKSMKERPMIVYLSKEKPNLNEIDIAPIVQEKQVLLDDYVQHNTLIKSINILLKRNAFLKVKAIVDTMQEVLRKLNTATDIWGKDDTSDILCIVNSYTHFLCKCGLQIVLQSGE